MMRLLTILKSCFIEAPVSDETIWHKRLRAPLFARTVNDNPVEIRGQVWRRKRNGKWEYQQDKETDDEFYSRAL